MKLLKASAFGSVAALGVASCCVLPLVLMALGLGGSWLAVFGKVAAASYYVLALASLLVILAWAAAWRGAALSRLKIGLAATTALTVLAWLVVLNEGRINDALISWM